MCLGRHVALVAWGSAVSETTAAALGLPRRTTPLLLCGAAITIVLVAACLRFYRLDYQSLFRDEGHTIVQAHGGWATLWRSAAEDAHPVLYWIVLRGWVGIFGASVWALRALSAV